MDIPHIPAIKSLRPELQGPRPSLLKVCKDSHNIKKPLLPPPPRPPVIIYTLTPKIIHANPEEFMSLVQRLTGLNSSCSSTALNKHSTSTSSSSAAFIFQENSGAGAISPAALLASIEKNKSSEWRKTQVFDHNIGMLGGTEIKAEIQRTGQLPGIFSPNPNALPPIPPKSFEPTITW